MKRLFLFIGSLPLGSRLQMLVVAILLAFHAWIDFKEGISVITVAIILFSWLVGWLLMPLMVAHPQTTTKVLGAFAIAIFAVYIFARNEWWWRTMAAHLGRELAMWLDLSCAYWFISEVRLQQERETMFVFPDADEFPSASEK